MSVEHIKVIDSHTGGEPTRVVVEGGPDLGRGSMAQRLAIFKKDFDHYRRAIVGDPRGSDVIVGAMLLDPVDPKNAAGLLFFNNTGYLGMCGHGAMGFMVTLFYLGRIGIGEHSIETPLGVISASIEDANTVKIYNVPSYRKTKDLVVEVAGYGSFVGDLAWGGNWFFICGQHGLEIDLSNLAQLADTANAIMKQLIADRILPDDQLEMLHVEFYAPSKKEGVNVKNFVMCPGNQYDRSPCGTGTSAKMSCLVADGKLSEGDIWRQESVIGSVFEGSVVLRDNEIHPSIKGQAHICGESTLILNANDPFRFGCAEYETDTCPIRR